MTVYVNPVNPLSDAPSPASLVCAILAEEGAWADAAVRGDPTAEPSAVLAALRAALVATEYDVVAGVAR